ncbi:MAG: large repetitive protein [Mycobacterium sp.]|nr:large repetitive protein [Mycobacterium sp.]
MSGRHRRALSPRMVNKRVMGAGLAGVAAVFAVAPIAAADPVTPTASDAPRDPTAGTAQVTDVPSTDVPSTDTPSSDVPSSDVPSSDTPSSDVSSSDTPSTDAPSTDAPTSDAPSTGTTADLSAPGHAKVAKAGQKAAVTSAPMAADFGAQKIRVGVQTKSGAWVPPDATTAGTELTIVETGPSVNGSVETTCTTVAGTATPTDDPSATFCTFPQFAATSRVTPAVTVQPGPSNLDFSDYYLAGPGDTVTVTQTTVNPHYLRDTETATVPPCDGVQLGIPFPICFGATDVVFDDGGLPPIATDDTAQVVAGHSVDIDVLQNDQTQGAPDKIDSVTDPVHGSAQIEQSTQTLAATNRKLAAASPATVLYTPDPGFVGHDTFSYTMSTPNGPSTATVSVTVLPPPPTAANDSASTVSGQAVTVNVLANDDAHSGGTLSVDSVGNPSHGTATARGSKIVYTPAADFVGTDTFTYTASTEFGSDTATVTVTVTAPPAAAADSNNGNLAETGVPSAELVDIAAGLLLAGGAASAFGRRRRPRGWHV